MKFERKFAVPLTGTPARMKVLPHIDISALENHTSLTQPMIVPSEDVRMEMIDNFMTESISRKCVYTYEDKYTFARILADDSLVFDSHFECGNLHSAFRSEYNCTSSNPRSQVYDLYLHSDIASSGHTQWFYFSVSNIKAGTEVTFVIRNFAKPDSLYNEGMRPLVYSMKSGKGWTRCGTNICYFASKSPLGASNVNASVDTTSSGNNAVSTLYTLCFTHVFEHTNDTCYFAYSFPYSYTDLQRYLIKVQEDPAKRLFCRRTELCKTIAGNSCDLLTITGPAKSAEELNSRVTIFITSRVHPGETNASWIMQGALDFLLSDTEEARTLRNVFVFKVVPMLNPDGVINGNYRTSLSGCDLNRRWKDPDPQKHPTIYSTKELIRKIRKHRTVGMILDIHGHSRKQGVFIYGCVPDKKLLRPISPPIQRKNSETASTSSVSTATNGARLPSDGISNRNVIDWRVKLLPRVLSATIPIFSAEHCSFKMQRSKANTMRIIAFSELGVDCVYTIEASLAGKFPFHFNVPDLLRLGQEICRNMLTIYPSMAHPKSQFYDSNHRHMWHSLLLPHQSLEQNRSVVDSSQSCRYSSQLPCAQSKAMIAPGNSAAQKPAINENGVELDSMNKLTSTRKYQDSVGFHEEQDNCYVIPTIEVDENCKRATESYGTSVASGSSDRTPCNLKINTTFLDNNLVEQMAFMTPSILSQFHEEIYVWRDFYDANIHGLGSSLLSECGKQDLFGDEIPVPKEVPKKVSVLKSNKSESNIRRKKSLKQVTGDSTAVASSNPFETDLGVPGTEPLDEVCFDNENNRSAKSGEKDKSRPKKVEWIVLSVAARGANNGVASDAMPFYDQQNTIDTQSNVNIVTRDEEPLDLRISSAKSSQLTKQLISQFQNAQLSNDIPLRDVPMDSTPTVLPVQGISVSQSRNKYCDSSELLPQPTPIEARNESIVGMKEKRQVTNKVPTNLDPIESASEKLPPRPISSSIARRRGSGSKPRAKSGRPPSTGVDLGGLITISSSTAISGEKQGGNGSGNIVGGSKSQSIFVLDGGSGNTEPGTNGGLEGGIDRSFAKFIINTVASKAKPKSRPGTAKREIDQSAELSANNGNRPISVGNVVIQGNKVLSTNM